MYDDWGWEYVKPWLYKVLLPYIQEAHRIVQGSYYQSRDHDRGPSDVGGGIGPRSPPSSSVDGPSSGIRRQDTLGIFHSPHLGGPSQGGSPMLPTSSPGGAFPPSLISEGHLSLLNQILQHARKNMDWDFIMDPSSPPTTPVWDAKGKLSNVVIAEGRGNTKKLAKNDGAKKLVTDLQDELTAAKYAQNIPNMAKQLALHLKEVRKQRDEVEKVSRFDNPFPVDKILRVGVLSTAQGLSGLQQSSRHPRTHYPILGRSRQTRRRGGATIIPTTISPDSLWQGQGGRYMEWW